MLRDPHHVPERLAVYAVDHYADAAQEWARRVRETNPDTPPAKIAEAQRRRTVSTARIDGAIAGTPFFIALVPAYIAYLQQEVRLHLRIAALYGNDPADPDVAADFLLLRGVHRDREEALAELAAVRANPVPERSGRRPLRAWYAAVMRVLVVAGFIGPPEDDDGRKPTLWARVKGAVALVVSGLLWALTWIFPITFMILMSWSCENDARRFGERVIERYAQPEEDLATVAAQADRRAGGHRTVDLARGAVVFASVALPLALIGSTLLRHHGPLHIQVPEAAGALMALALVIGVTVTAIRS